MSKLFRCRNANCPERPDFEAAAPTCPSCGAGAGMVEEIVPVHYLVPAEGPIPTSNGSRMVACQPALARLPKSASGERTAVTCPKCKATKIFAEDESAGTDNHVPIIENKMAAEHGIDVRQG